MISSAALCQTKGLGFLVPSGRPSSESFDKGTYASEHERVVAGVPSSRRTNAPPGWSQEELVGTKCRCQRDCFFFALANFSTSAPMWAERLSSTTCTDSPRGAGAVDLLEKGEHVGAGMAFAALGDDFAGADVQRREQVDGAVAFVVVGHRAATTGNQGRARAECDPRLESESSRRN